MSRALFCRIDIVGLGAPETEASEPGGEAFLKGSVWGRSARSWQRDIKAVSYHEADIRRGRDGWWETMVVFDI
jgi:SHS2 domain-containing protein